MLELLPAIIQGFTGLSQLFQGKDKLDGLQRPTYEIPNEVKQALTLARANYADQNMPGQAAMIDQNNLAAANAAQAALAGGGGLSSIAGIQAAQSAQANKIGIEAQNYQRQDEQQYAQQLANMADYKQQEWQINTFAPYQEKYQEGRQQVGAGQQNLFGAANSIANAGLAYAYMNSMLGNQPSVPTVIKDASTSADINSQYQHLVKQGSQMAWNYLNNMNASAQAATKISF